MKACDGEVVWVVGGEALLLMDESNICLSLGCGGRVRLGGSEEGRSDMSLRWRGFGGHCGRSEAMLVSGFSGGLAGAASGIVYIVECDVFLAQKDVSEWMRPSLLLSVSCNVAFVFSLDLVSRALRGGGDGGGERGCRSASGYFNFAVVRGGPGIGTVPRNEPGGASPPAFMLRFCVT